jgi:hypothetical protein
MLQRAAEMGDGYAMALFSRWTDDESWAAKAAELGEREGFLRMGEIALGRKDLELASSLLRKSCEMGSAVAASKLAMMLKLDDPERIKLLGVAAASGERRQRFLTEAERIVKLFNKHPGRAFPSERSLFLIGRPVKGNVDLVEKRIFGKRFDFEKLVGPLLQCVCLFDWACAAAKNTVNAWTMVAIRLGICFDVRRLIAKLIWEQREYVLNEL